MTEKTKISTLFTKKHRLDVINELRNVPELYSRYRKLSDDLKDRLLDFFCGQKTLPLTYDPFFKKLFNPEIYPERLESLIHMSILGKQNSIPDWGWICFRNIISSRLTYLRKVTILKVKRKRRRIDALWRVNAI